jgi:hypothetical protein
MKLAAHQPQYLPWLGYFDKMDRADLFVLLDTVQYKKNEWQNRNRIRTATGWQWLTVPVHYRFPMTMRQVRIDESSRWRRKHREAMRIHYARTPFFRPTFTEIEAILDASFENLSELNTRTIEVLAALLERADRIIWIWGRTGAPASRWNSRTSATRSTARLTPASRQRCRRSTA